MGQEKTNLPFNLPYNQSTHYWLAVFTPEHNTELTQALAKHGLKPMAGNAGVHVLRLSNPWDEGWKAVRGLLQESEDGKAARVALIPCR